MTDKEIARIFGLNLKKFLSIYGIKQNELAKRLGVGTSTVNNWVQGQKLPRMSKVDAMCEIFGCSRSAFIDETASILSPAENMLIDAYRTMNTEGQQKVIDYMTDLIDSGRYKKHDSDGMVQDA